MLINSNLLADKFKNGISLLAKRGYLQTGEQGICIKAVKGNQTAVAKTETEITITYDTEPHFYMALARSLGKEVHALGGALIAIENVVFAN